ncbi:MAG TPA: hypothetical protein DEG17_08150 [Cyanobacteria bacterium UBA11149]|nr:hypothetical protein [Cyanobacteria bacterium UBA11367]HBE56685.1 hypothetical protein [Cyanobacteria bacterium UBA11366]HBK65114.1 hypothetical protein [Cyanobacteria bacterium UBA11166]HBR73709.1 hypothetical protein [Cyanobacteria bacterium UBA11159]HBS67680.1 hypothetical protein [Cyanobacteria bacterium UBA11153]HBW88832.1 hypothetical protein [Cyanobacteria bacterium UBA11149]HCA97781.1 hypothetical protein [Cyanobacteria bacterium UBA9226]
MGEGPQPRFLKEIEILIDPTTGSIVKCQLSEIKLKISIFQLDKFIFMLFLANKGTGVNT